MVILCLVCLVNFKNENKNENENGILNSILLE